MSRADQGFLNSALVTLICLAEKNERVPKEEGTSRQNLFFSPFFVPFGPYLETYQIRTNSHETIVTQIMKTTITVAFISLKSAWKAVSLRTLLTALLLAPLAALPAEKAPITTGQSSNTHRFVCTDYAQGKVFVVSAEGTLEWEYPPSSCNDLWALPNGNFLFNTGTGVKAVTREKKVVFEHRGTLMTRTVEQKDGTLKEVQTLSEIYACQRLANGEIFH